MRNHEIDGIRGWAALMVICFHFFTELFGKIFPIFHSPFLGFLFDGQMMVLIFFILSGDALSLSFFSKSSNLTSIRLVVIRYFRLTFPILITCTLVYLIMILGLNYNLVASNVVDRSDWLGQFLNFDPSLNNLLHYSFNDVYFHHEAIKSYNPFLWTMSIEILGSMLIFLNIFILPHVKNIWKVLIAQFIFFMVFEPYYCLFIAGMILGGLRNRGYFEKIRASKYNYIFLILFLILIVYISIARESEIKSLRKSIKNMYEIWAILIVSLIYLNKSLLAFFSNRISRFLGDISFPLYAIQFVVLISVSSYLIVRLKESNILNIADVYIIGIVSIVLSILLAFGFRIIEKNFLKALNKWVLNKILK